MAEPVASSSSGHGAAADDDMIPDDAHAQVSNDAENDSSDSEEPGLSVKFSCVFLLALCP